MQKPNMNPLAVMEPGTLQILQELILIVDGIGIVVGLMVGAYYSRARHDRHIFWLMVYFFGVAIIYLAMTISDVIVIAKLDHNWAGLPIIRGLGFRAPHLMLLVILAWVIYGGRDEGRT